MKAEYGADMLLAVMAALGCTPRGEGGVASTDPLPLDGAFAMHADFLDEITVVDASGADVPVEVVYAEEYSPGGWAPGKRMAVRAVDGWVPAAEYVANVHIKDAMSSNWGWYEVPFTVSTEPAIPVEGVPGITVDSADVADFSCGPSTFYNVTLTPASPDPSGWSALLRGDERGRAGDLPVARGHRRRADLHGGGRGLLPPRHPDRRHRRALHVGVDLRRAGAVRLQLEHVSRVVRRRAGARVEAAHASTR